MITRPGIAIDVRQSSCSVSHSFVHSQSFTVIQSFFIIHSLSFSTRLAFTRPILTRYIVFSLPCSNTLLISNSYIIPCSRYVFLLYLSIYLSISFYHQRSLVVCSSPLQLSLVTFFVAFPFYVCSSLVTRYSTYKKYSLVTRSTHTHSHTHSHTHTGRSKCNRPLCSMAIVPAALLFVPISSLFVVGLLVA